MTVAVGAVLGTGHDEIITGTGAGYPQVRTFDLSAGTNGITATMTSSFFAYSATNGVRVGTEFLSSSSSIASILTGEGNGGDSTLAYYFSTLNSSFDTSFTYSPSSQQYTQQAFIG